MASCGGVGGSSNNSGSNSNSSSSSSSSAGRGSGSVGGSNSAGSVGNNSSDSNKSSSVGTSADQNEAAQANNTDGANAKNGISREAQQKSDLNGKMDAAQDQPTENQTTEEAKTEQTKADFTTEQVKAEQVKAEQVKTEQVKANVKTEQSLTEKVAEKAKEVMAKATELAKTAKEEIGKAVEKAQAQAAFAAKQQELATLARDPKVRAMLDTIGFTEGTGLNYGKVVNGTVIGQNKKTMGFDATLAPGARNVSTLDMSQHPNVKVQVNKNIVSSAAGRYQFLSRTWEGVSQRLGLTNFHASSQDLAAVQLMRDRNMIAPLQAGDLQTAINRGAAEWASLPKADGSGAYAGQNARSFAAIENAYKDFLSNAEAMAQAGDFN